MDQRSASDSGHLWIVADDRSLVLLEREIWVKLQISDQS